MNNSGSRFRGPILVRKSGPRPTPVFETYWRFAVERQEIFWRRLRGESRPWTSDPVLRRHKFTNTYRASDRTSQYLIRHIIYRAEDWDTFADLFFNVVLFKIFNRIDTWKLLRRQLGKDFFDSSDLPRIDSVLSEAFSTGSKIYSAAYIMPNPRGFGGSRKHSNHLALLRMICDDRIPERIQHASSMAEAFEILRGIPSFGSFLAYQYITDLNYSDYLDFSESEFVVPGPGALNGIQKCFADLGELTSADVIRHVADCQEEEFSSRDLTFRGLGNRRLQYIDCQNLFCEVDKYARVVHPEHGSDSGRSRIKQLFKVDLNPLEYWYPPKWGVNDIIAKSSGPVQANLPPGL